MFVLQPSQCVCVCVCGTQSRARKKVEWLSLGPRLSPEIITLSGHNLLWCGCWSCHCDWCWLVVLVLVVVSHPTARLRACRHTTCLVSPIAIICCAHPFHRPFSGLTSASPSSSPPSRFLILLLLPPPPVASFSPATDQASTTLRDNHQFLLQQWPPPS